MKPLTLSEEQILAFRARRGFLLGKGAVSAQAVAQRLVGVQAQVWGAALMALSQRMKRRPTAKVLQEALLGGRSRRLVRTWAQRDTLHLLEARGDWERVVRARADWAPGGRQGDFPPLGLLNRVRRLVERWDRPLARSDLFAHLTESYVAQVRERVNHEREAQRFAAGRLIWMLALEGELALGSKRGAEQLYERRELAFPEVAWGKESSEAAAAEVLTLNYLRCYGPATPQDVAHFFGARVSAARRWLERLQAAEELVPVECGNRRGLVACVRDRSSLKAAPPTAESSGAEAWPLRLLPGYDSLMMGHADKSWTVPNEEERSRVWRKAAVVAPVVLDRGRVVATWRHERKKERLLVTVEPLQAWRVGRHQKAVMAEAEQVASHLDCATAEVVVG